MWLSYTRELTMYCTYMDRASSHSLSCRTNIIISHKTAFLTLDTVLRTLYVQTTAKESRAIGNLGGMDHLRGK